MKLVEMEAESIWVSKNQQLQS